MYTVVKRLHFCYGHRLLDYEGKCAHPHGHNAFVEVELSRATLDDCGMVLDFGEVDLALDEFIDTELDHRMLLRHDDPLVAAFRSVGEEPYIMKFNPTAENIARLLFQQAKKKGLPVVAVRLWETEQAYAEYRE